MAGDKGFGLTVQDLKFGVWGVGLLDWGLRV